MHDIAFFSAALIHAKITDSGDLDLLIVTVYALLCQCCAGCSFNGYERLALRIGGSAQIRERVFHQFFCFLNAHLRCPHLLQRHYLYAEQHRQ